MKTRFFKQLLLLGGFLLMVSLLSSCASKRYGCPSEMELGVSTQMIIINKV